MHRFVSQVCQKKPNLMVLLITGSLGSYHTQVPHEQSTCFYKSTHVCTYHQCMQQGTNLVWHECTRNTEKDNGRRCAGPGNTDVVDNYRLRLMSRVYIYPRDIYNAFFRDNYSIEVYISVYLKSASQFNDPTKKNKIESKLTQGYRADISPLHNYITK